MNVKDGARLPCPEAWVEEPTFKSNLRRRWELGIVGPQHGSYYRTQRRRRSRKVARHLSPSPSERLLPAVLDTSIYEGTSLTTIQALRLPSRLIDGSQMASVQPDTPEDHSEVNQERNPFAWLDKAVGRWYGDSGSPFSLRRRGKQIA